FSVKDMGEADVILGIRIKHESNGMAISQSHYIEKVLKKFNYFDYTSVSTPMDTSEKLMPNNVSKLSRHTSNPGTQHWQAIQRISNTEDNSSTSGWVFLLGRGAISWAFKKQTCITGSTMESEFVALAAASKEAKLLKNLLLEIPLWSKPITPISIHCDSVATLAKAYTQMYNGKSRHLGVRHSMIRELITNRVISIEFVRSQQNLADHLTKGLARDLVLKSAEGMGLKSNQVAKYQLIRRIHQLDTTYRPFYSEQRIDLCSLNNVSILPNNTAYSVKSIRRTDLQSTKTSDGLAAIQAQLNNIGREIKKVNEKVYATQVGCELCKGPHYEKDCPLKEEGRTLEEAYYTQNSLYPDRRQTLEESLTKFIVELAKRHEENSNIIKEIRASTDAAIRNQGASIKTLEIQIGQMSKVLQERGIRGLPGSTEPNPRDHVKSISIAKANSSAICHIGSGPYAVSDAQYNSLFSETVLFPSRLHGYYCDDWKEAREVKILETYDHTLPQKEKDPGSFTLPCFIHDICFDKALVDLEASVSVMPFSTYSNLGLGFIIIDDEDVTRYVALGMLFFMKYVSCQMIMKKFAQEDKCERIMDE
ncbi:hypothetical protein Tco_0659780, partial [Tanacetum coccineum]